MEDKKYMISEAAKMVDVESHVLRYWEEELHISVNRTQMGHRYYTEEDIQLFCCIKKLKDEGISIKELKILMPYILETREKTLTALKAKREDSSEDKSLKIQEKSNSKPASRKSAKRHEIIEENTDSKEIASLTAAENLSVPEVITDVQLQQVRNLIGNVLNEVVASNNEVLKKDISRDVTANVMKEMKFLMQAKDRRDEEHFRKLDIMIRQQQTLRKEAATVGPIEKIRKILT